MDALKILADHHKDWIKIVKGFGEYELAEDVVQDVYIRIVKYNYESKIIKDGKPNIALMWIMLRNRTFEINKTGSLKFLQLDVVRDIADDSPDLQKHESLERLHEKIDEEISNWHWYDSKLFNIYKKGGLSMRDLAEETNISLTSIFITLKNCKDRLRDNVSEDYEDFVNEDFDLI